MCKGYNFNVGRMRVLTRSPIKEGGAFIVCFFSVIEMTVSDSTYKQLGRYNSPLTRKKLNKPKKHLLPRLNRAGEQRENCCHWRDRQVQGVIIPEQKLMSCWKLKVDNFESFKL